MTRFMGSNDPLALIAVQFNASRDLCQHYSGPAVVVRLKKGGMYECRGENGEVFEECKTKIMRGI